MTYFRHNIFESVYLFITIYTSKSFAEIIRKNDLLSSQYFRIHLFIYHDLYFEIIRWDNSKKRLTFDSSQYFRIRPFIHHDLYLEIATERFEKISLSILHNISSNIFESVRLFTTIIADF